VDGLIVMPGRIVLFGATGYTGRLTATALVERHARPVLAGRDAARLQALADELGGGLETAAADVARPETVRALVAEGDVLLSTVGPFARFGAPAVEAAIDGKAAYIDSTGEPAFIRRVFEEWGPRAAVAGIPLLTAMGYDWVPGNLASSMALSEAGDRATKAEIGYFNTGAGGRDWMSGGTAASTAGALLEPVFAFRGGHIVSERAAQRVQAFDVSGRERTAVSVGSSEHFALPLTNPGLREVDAYLGWFGPLSRPMQAASLLTSGMARVPGFKQGADALVTRFVKGSTGGPDAEQRARSGSLIVGRARDAADHVLAEVVLEGVNGYDFTGAILAWAALQALAGGVDGTGAVGPQAFGLEALEKGCAEAGISRRSPER
jgi:short subunit dehydrogenase-like uncharacterized protein